MSSLRIAISILLSALSALPLIATSWGPREDVGVAVVDTRTGKVLWEAWRPDEVPAGTTPEEKNAVEFLLATTESRRKPAPDVTPLEAVSVKELTVKNPWPKGKADFGESASVGKGLIYYVQAMGVIAFDRTTKQEVWRLETTRYPYPSQVLEAGKDRAFIQIGSRVPWTISAGVVRERGRLPMLNLEPHTLQQRAAAAVLLHLHGDGYLRPEVLKIAAKLREEKADPAAEAAAKAVEQLHANWPLKRDQQRLLEGCVAALLKSQGDPFRNFPWPGAYRKLVWCTLQELVYGNPHDGHSRQGYNYAYDGWEERPVSLPDAVKVKLVDHCRQAVVAGPDYEKAFAASILVSTGIGWSRLTDADRKALFHSSQPSAWRWAAVGLAKNSRREQLIAWGSERPVEDHVDLLWVLRHDKPKEIPDKELPFWIACAKRNPGSVAGVLQFDDRVIPTVFRAPIREYLEREIAKPTATDLGRHNTDVYAAIKVLNEWKNPADTPLLTEYLKHPAYHSVTRIDGNGRTALRVYTIRQRVSEMLAQRGVKVPAGVVYEEVVGPEPE